MMHTTPFHCLNTAKTTMLTTMRFKIRGKPRKGQVHGREYDTRRKYLISSINYLRDIMVILLSSQPNLSRTFSIVVSCYTGPCSITAWLYYIFIAVMLYILKINKANSGPLPANVHIRDHCVYELSQWEMTLQCNVISHWLSSYTEWSLHVSPQLQPCHYTHLSQGQMSSEMCFF